MDKQKIVFVEIPEEGFASVLKMAHEWVSFNIDSISNMSSAYGVIVNTDGDKPSILRTLTITYEGEQKIDPQTCKHTSLTEKIVSVATCTSNGLKKQTCTNCGKVMKESKIPMIPHTGGNWVKIINPTCIKAGMEWKRCTLCNTILNRRDIDLLPHVYPDEWTVKKNPTYDDFGIEYKRCVVCDNEITQQIPKLIRALEILTTGRFEYVDGSDVNISLTSNYDNVTWNIESGNLPTGLSLNNGVISGTLNTNKAMISNVVIGCTNEHNEHVTKEIAFNITPRMYSLTLDPNGGTVDITVIKRYKGQSVGTLPIPELDGKVFGGWFTAMQGGIKVNDGFIINNDMTIYARWGESSDIVFGDATSEFNIQVDGDRTNYNNNPYTLYYRKNDAGTSNLEIRTGISSTNGTNNMTDANREVTLYLKVTNKGDSGNFDIGFDCDSYVSGDDRIKLTRVENGVELGERKISVTVPYNTTVWVGHYGERASNRYNNMSVGSAVGTGTNQAIDTGYALTMNDIYIDSGMYTILEVKFTKL